MKIKKICNNNKLEAYIKTDLNSQLWTDSFAVFKLNKSEVEILNYALSLNSAAWRYNKLY